MRAREIPALLFVLVWVLGFEVVPTLHLAMHASLGAHTHGATHCHAGFCHADDEASGDETDAVAHDGATQHDGAQAQKAPPHSSRSHGQGSLAHRGVAALAPELAVLVPELLLVGELPLPEAPVVYAASFEAPRPPARAPPAA